MQHTLQITLGIASALISAGTLLAEVPSMHPARQAASLIPVLDESWTLVAKNPELGELAGASQEVVDFAIWQAADSTWQIWACVRKTAEPGKSRLFHRWEGRSVVSEYESKGVAMRADPTLGETPGGMQAPYVIREGGEFRMFYGDWVNICAQAGTDGKSFTRLLNSGGVPALFDEGPAANARDPMLIQIGGLWHCYYTAHPGDVGSVFVRTSSDLVNWSEGRIVAPGGADPYSVKFAAECPFVVEPVPGEYYLFLTQRYGRNSQTTVVRSSDPLDFDFGRDPEKIMCLLPIAAPEVFQHDGQWFVAAVAPDYSGVQITTLRWKEVNAGGQSIDDSPGP
ncbi:MAG TPA: hypothetical protein VMM36_17350 [Opitutaceae bacterium]|nr:hypothetical protein [Opitutaceae bacterium]